MRRGYTSLELIVVLLVVTGLLGIAVPRMVAILDAIEVERAAREILGAYRRARITAIMRSRTAVLTVGPTALTIRARGDTADLWRSEGPAAAGVTLAGPTRQITFSPVGLTTGVANATFHLSRRSASRTIVVSRLGRARILR